MTPSHYAGLAVIAAVGGLGLTQAVRLTRASTFSFYMYAWGVTFAGAAIALVIAAAEETRVGSPLSTTSGGTPLLILLAGTVGGWAVEKWGSLRAGVVVSLRILSG